jgi:hypothetical protein
MLEEALIQTNEQPLGTIKERSENLVRSSSCASFNNVL